MTLLSGLRFGGNPEITTPKGFTVQVEPPADSSQKGARSTVRVEGDQVTFSRPLEARYQYWLPQPGEIREDLAPLWTHDYVGTHEGFYNAGYRWGVVLDDVLMTKPNGKRGVNLPDGKYMIAIKQQAGGRSEVVIGLQDRGIDQAVLSAFDAGNPPAEKASLKVSNHTMLITRGKPVDWDNPDAIATVFCGEIDVRDNRIEAANDQSGQFFGPKGLTQPLKPGEEAPADSRVMKNPAYDQIKSTALLHATQVLEALTGQSDIRMVKVAFVDDNPPDAELRTPRTLDLKPRHANKLTKYLVEPAMQTLVDQFDNDPKAQTRLLKALGKNGKYRHAILELCTQLQNQGTLKPEQAPKLTLELLQTPDAIGLFLPQSPLYLPQLSDNTRRKVAAAYNKLFADTKNPKGFSEFVQEIRQYPSMISFLTGRRVAGGFIKGALDDMGGMTDAITLLGDLLRTINAPPAQERQTVKHPLNVLFTLHNAGKQIGNIEKRLKKRDPVREPVIVYNNPFELPVLSAQPKLAKNIARLRKLEERGVPVSRLPASTPETLVDYLSALYTLAGEPRTAVDAIQQQQMEAVLASYGVDPDALLSFAQDKFSNRWSNDLILTTLADHDPTFSKLVDDLTWFYGLPQKTLDNN